MTLDSDSLRGGGGKKGKSVSNSRAQTPCRETTPAVHARAEAKHYEYISNGSSRQTSAVTRDSDSSRGGLDMNAVDEHIRRTIGGSAREVTPASSPSRKRQRINGDR